jgi:hypothetical protein
MAAIVVSGWGVVLNSRRPLRSRQSAIVGAAFAALLLDTSLTLLTMLPASAEDRNAAGRTEMQKAVVSLFSRPSLDTTPIVFSVGGINYRVPRNYLTTMYNWSGGPQGLVTITVNLPDLKPLSEETRPCFTAKPLDRPPGCEPFSVRISGTGGPSADDVFANMRPLFRSPVPIKGPDEFDKFEIGPDDHRIEYYIKVENGHTRLYSCQISDNHGRRDGVCHPDADRVSSGAVIQFFFSLRYLKSITQIDANLRNLVEKFTLQSGESK